MKKIFTKQSTTEVMGIPHFSEYPEHQHATSKKAELLTRLDDVNARAERYRMASIALQDGELDSDAQHLLQTGELRPEHAREDIHRLENEARTIRRAAQIQDDELIKLEDKLSVEICEPLKAPYAALVERVLAAAAALSDAARAEEDFRRILDQRGVRHEHLIRPVIVAGLLGEPDPRTGEYRLIERLLEAARDAGHLQNSKAA